jgi:hypothetical protein
MADRDLTGPTLRGEPYIATVDPVRSDSFYNPYMARTHMVDR